MNAEDREVLARIDRLAQELLDKDWLELGVSQEELDRSRLSTQQMYSALREGYSMDEVLEMFDCLPAEETAEQNQPVDCFANLTPVQTEPGAEGERQYRKPTLIEAPTIIEAAGNNPKRR